MRVQVVRGGITVHRVVHEEVADLLAHHLGLVSIDLCNSAACPATQARLPVLQNLLTHKPLSCLAIR